MSVLMNAHPLIGPALAELFMRCGSEARNVASTPKKRSTSVCRAEGGDGELIAAIKERRWRDGARK